MNNLGNTVRNNRLSALNAIEERKRAGLSVSRHVRPVFISARSSV